MFIFFSHAICIYANSKQYTGFHWNWNLKLTWKPVVLGVKVRSWKQSSSFVRKVPCNKTWQSNSRFRVLIKKQLQFSQMRISSQFFFHRSQPEKKSARERQCVAILLPLFIPPHPPIILSCSCAVQHGLNSTDGCPVPTLWSQLN